MCCCDLELDGSLHFLGPSGPTPKKVWGSLHFWRGTRCCCLGVQLLNCSSHDQSQTVAATIRLMHGRAHSSLLTRPTPAGPRAKSVCSLWGKLCFGAILTSFGQLLAEHWASGRGPSSACSRLSGTGPSEACSTLGALSPAGISLTSWPHLP